MKRSEIKRRPLADTVLEKLEPESKDYRELDSQGLYFRVRPSGKKSWDFRYKRSDGKWAWKNIGRYPKFGGKEAREESQRLSCLVNDGFDPNEPELLEAEPSVLGFKEFAESWYRNLERRLERKNVGQVYVDTCRRHLNKDIYPVIGNLALHEVRRKDCLKIQKRFEDRGAYQAAIKNRRIMSDIFRSAVDDELLENNPAHDLHRSPKTKEYPESKNYPFLVEYQLPDFLKSLENSDGKEVVTIGFRMLLLTAARPGMVLWAEWSEIDLDNGLWDIHEDKMKESNAIVVPLSKQLVRELKKLKQITGKDRYLFPTKGGETRPVRAASMFNTLIDRLGYAGKIVGHGVRHTASTLLRGHGWGKQYTEMMLAHVEGGSSGIYNKAKYLKQRQVMMQWYADYLDALRDGTTEEREEEFASQVIR